MQQGREPLDLDCCSFTIDRGVDNDILQQPLLNAARQMIVYVMISCNSYFSFVLADMAMIVKGFSYFSLK